MGGLQRGRDEDAVDAIDSGGASPEAPDRLSVPPVPAVVPTERVQLRRRPREVVPGLQPSPRTVRLAARAVTLHSLFLVRHGSVPDAVSLYGRGARPITGVSIYAPVSTVPSPARAEALCALSPKTSCFGLCLPRGRSWRLSSRAQFTFRTESPAKFFVCVVYHAFSTLARIFFFLASPLTPRNHFP